MILRGQTDPSTDLWTLPINGTCPDVKKQIHKVTNVAGFTHSLKTRANAVKFEHQSLCNQKIYALLKATRKGFLKGCLNISEELICKYLNPRPATAKGHMKRPSHGIKSTTPKKTWDGTNPPVQAPVPVPVPIQKYAAPRVIPIEPLANLQYTPGPPLKSIDHNKAIAKVFCFGAFADKNTGIVYHDMTGNFPFMSLDGNVCYFIMYHYESNSILATARRQGHG